VGEVLASSSSCFTGGMSCVVSYFWKPHTSCRFVVRQFEADKHEKMSLAELEQELEKSRVEYMRNAEDVRDKFEVPVFVSTSCKRLCVNYGGNQVSVCDAY
jgi:hypothetical protein